MYIIVLFLENTSYTEYRKHRSRRSFKVERKVRATIRTRITVTSVTKRNVRAHDTQEMCSVQRAGGRNKNGRKDEV